MATSSSTISAYRDRTAEFLSLSERLKKKTDNISEDLQHTSQKPSTSQSQSSEFKKKTSQIGLGIFETSQRISRLAQLSKKSSMFNDPLMEIQQLTALIKDDITSLNMGLSDLQALQNIEIANENCSKDRSTHATTICDDLKSRLMGTTKQFQDVLTTRTENLKAHENRKQIFSTNASREKPFLSPAKSLTEPPPWSNNTHTDSQSST
ncbi:syntaxin protein [Ranunculus cassubicifolius]